MSQIITTKYLKDNSGNIISPITSIDSIQDSSGGEVLSYLINLIYPVGSIYISINNTNPNTYLNGTTWVAWGSGKVPVGVDTSDTNFNTVEKTGGEKTHTLTINEMPNHSHALNNYNGGGNTEKRGVFFLWENTHGDVNYQNFNNPNAWSQRVGGGQAHNNLQPYITCYMWKRTK